MEKVQPLRDDVIAWIAPDHLVSSPFNSRKHFDKARLAELADSIRKGGIQQPLLVRPLQAKVHDDGRPVYEIIAGERRWRAAKLIPAALVPCLVRDVTDVTAHRMQVVENLQREGITPLEEAQAFQDLLKAEADANAGKPSVEGVAKEIGKSKEYVYGRLKLLKLSAAARQSLEAGKLTAGHAVELVPLDELQQKKALGYLAAEAEQGHEVSVMDLREAIRTEIAPPPAPPKSKARKAEERRFRERQAKTQAQNRRRLAAEQAASDLKKLVYARALPLLWAKLKVIDGKTRERMIDHAIRAAVHDGTLGLAQKMAAGKEKPGSTDYPTAWVAPDYKAFERAPRAERLALYALASTMQYMHWNEKKNAATWQWAGIDLKKIAAEVKAEAKAKAAANKATPQPEKTERKKPRGRRR